MPLERRDASVRALRTEIEMRVFQGRMGLGDLGLEVSIVIVVFSCSVISRTSNDDGKVNKGMRRLGFGGCLTTHLF